MRIPALEPRMRNILVQEVYANTFSSIQWMSVQTFKIAWLDVAKEMAQEKMDKVIIFYSQSRSSYEVRIRLRTEAEAEWWNMTRV